LKLGLAAIVYNRSYSGSRDQEGHYLCQPGQKVGMTPSQLKQLGMVVHMCNPNYVGRIVKKITAHAALGKKYKTLSKKELKQKGLGAWLKC
jgi:hypothetical protein